MSESGASDPVLDALWERASSDFRVDEPNRAFIEHCRQARALAIAARRYREARSTAAPDLTEAIDARLAAITAAALADLASRRDASPAPSRPWWLHVAAALVLLVALYGLAAAFGR
ncbi:MAG: hypothetical protein FJ096_16345 [Deltaproteobacteria bacterium]|nr:hypothetical protein [Deltaproteobacteria bacterium]